jgi:hypothetical protein
MDKPMTQLKDLIRDHADRRQDPRYSCRLEGTIETGRGPVPCEILSLSSGGLSARCRGQLGRGDFVDVRSHQVRPGAEPAPLRCLVEWASKPGGDQMVRLSAQEPPEALQRSWLHAEIQELGERARQSRQRRGGVRVHCQLPATVRLAEREHPATIADLGTAGARVEAPSASLSENATFC